MKKILLILSVFTLSILAFATPQNFCNITSQSYYVVPKKFNSTCNAYEVHFTISGTTNASSILISSQGNRSLAPIPVVNHQFFANVIVDYYISPTPQFNTHYLTTVTSCYNDSTSSQLHYQSGTMQVIING